MVAQLILSRFLVILPKLGECYGSRLDLISLDSLAYTLQICRPIVKADWSWQYGRSPLTGNELYWLGYLFRIISQYHYELQYNYIQADYQIGISLCNRSQTSQ